MEGRIEGVNKAAKAAGKRAVRKDAVVMADVVVTLPENVRKGDEFKFFGYAYWFLIRKLGKENMMGGFVHRDGVARDVAELEPIAADVRRFEGAGRAERGAILDSIAARCAGAARAARAAIEELGDRIWALMRPRKAQRTERDLDDVMREATEVARATKALSRNHVAPTNSRPRGQAR